EPKPVVVKELPDDGQRIVRRAIIDDDRFKVAKRLQPDGFESGADEAAEVIRSDDDAQQRFHAAAPRFRASCLFTTSEMQKRYLPDGSCGIASMNSQFHCAAVPKSVATNCPSRFSLSAPNTSSRTMRNKNRSTASCTIWICATPGTCSAKFSVSDMPDMNRPS